jgi:hypothetical protein
MLEIVRNFVINAAILIMTASHSYADTEKNYSYICKSEAMFGWEKQKISHLMSKLNYYNRWVLQPIEPKEYEYWTNNGTTKNYKFKATYELKKFGKDKATAFCRTNPTGPSNAEMYCLQTSVSNEDEIFDLLWYFETGSLKNKLMTYVLVDWGNLSVGGIEGYPAQNRPIEVAFEQGDCEAF